MKLSPIGPAGAIVGLVPLLFAAGISAAVSPTRFADVPKSHWAWLHVEKVATEQLMTGPGERPGYFHPEGAVNRAQLAKVSAGLLERIERLESELASP